MKKFSLKKYRGSQFVKDTVKLTSGTAISQVLAICMAPILYRIYDKEFYGILGVFMAITGVLGSFSSMQYSQAIIIEEKDENALSALWLVRIINALLSLFTLIIVIFASDFIANLFNAPGLSNWLYLLPLSIFFSGQNEIFRFWANRKGEFGLMSINSILVALIVPIVSIFFGLTISNSPIGLFVGLIIGQMIPAISMFFYLSKKQSFKWETLNIKNVNIIRKKHYKFPLYSLPAEFINRLSNQLPVFVLSTFSGPAYVGAYNLSVRMLSMPIQLLSGSVYEVFRKRAVDDLAKFGNCKHIFIKTLKTLSLLSIAPMLTILLFGTQIFTFVFGMEWYLAGVFSQILCGLYFVKFIVSPLSFMFILYQKQKQDFLWHIWMIVSSFMAFYIGFILENNILHSLGLFSINYVIIYIIYLFKSYNYSKGFI